MNRTGSKILHGMLLATSAMVGSGMIISTAAMANPAGGSVAVGSATITNPSATQTVIKQSSQRALINWNSFNVGSGSSVTFNQPNTKSLTVNRVTGPGSSTINGSLTANGNIWLLNANGILFGKGSQINVGSLLATTSELSDADFKAGNNNFTSSPNPNATVINQGTITASRGGSVVLSAPAVSNEGMIQADLGTVVLGGAQAFTVDMTGDNLLRYQISAPVSQTPTDGQGKPALALVNNSGTIAANGGHVVMTARAAQNVQDNVINNTGMVEATSVSVHNGEVDIDAGPDGTANVGGTVDVSGSGSGQTGGTVTVTGGTVNVADGAKINASGSAGGGTVLIGGGPHGTGTLAHAQRTIIGAATINADATVNGNGGNVTVWSDGTTQFNGSISARGGAQGGNGGQVETSGHNLGVSSSAKVDTSAPLGLTGDWLLDPTTIEIVNGADGTDDPISGTASTISNGTIIAALASSNVTLEATAGNPSCASISVDSGAPITWSSGNTLSLLSEGNITIQSNIQSSGAGGINIIAGWDGSTGVAGSYNGANSVDVSAITTGGAYGNACGSVSIGSFASVGSASGVTTIAGYDVTLNASAGLAQIGYYGNGGGDIFVDAKDNVVLTADPASDPFDIAQIGNDGATGTSSQTGNITVVAGNDVTLTGGGASSYAQIGNGGNHNSTTTNGDVSGNISINATGDVSLTGGSGGFALIGNGAEDSNETNSGDINITAHDVTLLGGNSEFAQIGNGGFDSQGGSGNITVNATGNISLTADPSSEFGYAQIGNGGETSNAGSGNITVTAGGNVTLTSGEEYAQIGNGGANFDLPNSGNVTVNVTGNLTLTGTGSDDGDGYALIGLGGSNASDSNSGNISVFAGNLSMGSSVNTTRSQIGNYALFGDNDGDLSLTVAGATDLSNDTGTIVIGIVGADGSENAFISTGSLTDPDHVLDASLAADLANGNVTFADGSDYTFDPSSSAVGGNTDLTLISAGNLTIEQSIQNSGTGNVTLVSGWNSVNVTSANLTAATSTGTVASLFAANASGYNGGGNITIGGDDALQSVAVGSANGTTSVFGGNVTLSNSNGSAQIGFAGGVATGKIVVDATGALTLTGGDNLHTYAQIGHGSYNGAGDESGDIKVTAASVNMTAGSVQTGYAQIGHGGVDATGSLSGNISVTATTGDITLQGTGDGYALIGHGGEYAGDFAGNPDVLPAYSGNITVTTNIGSISLTGADDPDAQGGSAQIGDVGFANDTGAITVNSARDISLAGGTSNGANGNSGLGLAYAQIGSAAAGTVDVDVKVNAGGDLTLTAGAGAHYNDNPPDDNAQIGNGAWDGDGSGGDITVNVTGTTTIVTSSATTDNHAWIGNIPTGGSSGTTTITTGKLDTSGDELSDFTNSIADDLSNGDVSITYTNQTSSGVGELDYDSTHNLTIASTGDLTLDNAIDNTGNGRVSLDAGFDPTQGNIGNAGTLTINTGITTAGDDTTYTDSFEAGDGIVIGGDIDVGGGRIYMRAGEYQDGVGSPITDADGYTLTADTISILNDKGGADTTIGTSDAPIEISANHLSVEVADDDVYIDSPNGGFDVGDGGVGISDIGGNVTLSANGSITQNTIDSLGIEASTLSVTTTGADHAIALTDGGDVGDGGSDYGNDISGAVSLNSAADLTFTNTETTLLTDASAGGVISIDVTNANQDTGDNGDARLIVNGAITADGTGQSTLHAVGDIVNDPLVNPNAPFDDETNPASINTAITADELNLISDNGSVGGVDLAGDTTFLLGTVANALHVSTGSAGGVNVSNGKSFTIGIAGDGTGLNVGTKGGYIGAATGDMTQLSGADGAIVSTGGIAFGATGSFTLDNTDNQVSGDLTLYAHSGSSVSFTNNGTTTLGGIAEDLFDTTTVGGNVTLTVTNGSLSQSGALYADNLTINAAGGNDGSFGVNLTNSDNELTGTLTVTTPGDVNFTNSEATTLGTISNGTSSSAGNVTITVGNGTLSQGEGTSILAATLTVNAANGSVVLTNTSNNVTGAFSGNVSGDVSFENNSTITLGDVDGGLVYVAACGPIPAHYDPIAAGNITITALHGGINVTGGVLGTNISLVAPGNITQEHDSGLDGENFNVTSSSANISLLSDNDFTGTINISAANGTAAFGNNDNTLLGTVNVKGDLTVLSEGNLTVSSSIQNAGSANITLVGGWDGSTTDSASLGNDGVYGNYDSDGTYGDVFIGDGSGSGLVSVGSKSGLTTIEGHAINVNAANGSQIGYNGSGGTGNINILGTGVLTLGGSSPHFSQIGNGSIFGQKSASGDIIIDAGSISVTGNASYLAGNNASIETTAGDIGSSDHPLVVALNTIAIPFAESDDEEGAANVYILSPGGGISIGNDIRNVGGNGIQTNGGDLVLTATGDITQTSSVLTGSADISTSSGNITLTSGGNQIGSVSLSAPVNATLYDTVDLTVTGGGATGNLTLLTTGDLTFTDTVQKTSGDILAVAGWDGTTAPSDIAANATSYGNNSKNIIIGGVHGDGDVSVGSATGTTSVYGYDVDIDAENGLAQLGYNGNGTGTINVTARHDVSVTSTGGEEGCEYECSYTGGFTALIGNGSFDATGAVGGNITVNAGHDIFLDAEDGDGEDYNPNFAAIGNIGDGPSVNGTINITAAGNISLYDTNAAYTRIGNDGDAEGVAVSGDINVTANGTQGIGLTDDLDGWGSQIGNYVFGGGASVGGNVTVTANYGGIVLDAGGDGAQIGNYGTAGDGEVAIGGNVSVYSLGGDLQLEGSDDTVAQIGNSGDANGGTMGGNVTVNVTGNLNLTATFGGYVQIGNGSPLGFGNDGPIGGNINVNATGNITLTASSETDRTYALIGNGDLTGESTGSVSGDINLHSGGALTFDDVSGNDQVWLGNIGGTDTEDGDIESGNVTVVANSENDLDEAAFGEMLVADLGTSNASGGNVFVGMTSSVSKVGGLSYNSPHTFTIASTANLNVTGSIQNAGAGALNLIGGWNGNTTLPTSPLTTASGYFGNNNGNVTIGGGTLAAVGSKSGVTTVAGSNVNVNGAQAGAQIGYAGAASGNISVQAKHDVALTAGSCANCDAQIGDGGSNATLSGGGNISVHALGNVTLSGGSQSFAYAQIGNGGDSSTGSFGGNINVTSGGAVSLTGSFDYAQIGNGGDGAQGNAGGNITISANGNVNLTGASSNKNGYAQIGNGGESANGNESGNINVTSNGTIALTAGNNGRYAQIGNGVADSGSGSSTGNITVKAAGLTLTGSTSASTQDDFAEIGNNANNAGASGNISVNVTGTTDFVTTEGGGNLAIGNYVRANGSISGNVSIITGDFSDDDDNNGDVVQFLTRDITGGAVTLGITDVNANSEIGGLDYSSANTLTLLMAGNLTVDGDIQNSGTGNVTLVTGWNTAVAPSAVATTAGAYGNHNATLTIGGSDSPGKADVGSAGGTTTVLTNNLTLNSVNGIAQLGFNGNGGGAINVAALGNVLLEGSHVAQIGNGGPAATGTVGGAINVNAGGNITLNTVAGSIAAIGNMGGTNASESGNIAVTSRGAVTVNATANNTFAHIGNWTDGDTAGTSSGNIVVNATSVALNSGGSQSYAVIGNGDFHAGTDSGPVSGNISVNTGALTLASNGTSGSSQVRIGDLGAGTANGSLSFNVTGNVLLSASNDGLIDIGNTGLSASPSSGNLSMQSGGTISLLVANGGEARISDFGAQTGTLSVNAAGNILLQTSGTNPDGSAVAFIGGLTNGTSNEAVSVTSANGNITLQASAPGGVAQIGDSAGSATAVSTGNITVSAAHGSVIVAATGANADATIGAVGGVDTGTISVAAQNVSVTSSASGGLADIGFVTTGSGSSANGAVNVTASNAVAVAQSNGGTAQIGNTAILGGSVSGATTITGQSLTGLGASAMNDLASGNVSLTSLGSGDLVLSGGSANSGNNLVVASAGNIDVTGTMQNAGNGNITLSGNGAVTVGGSGASGAASVGSKGGTTKVSGASVQLSAINGYAQIGYHGGGSGAILVNATGDITLNGGSNTAYFAQIGDGGYKVSGSNSGAVSVSANGNVTLNAGSGQEAYAQIGNGGAESNSNSTGYTDTGAITISGNAITLGAGSGGAAYAQIGDGGYKSGQSVNGASTVGGDININAVSGVTLNGNAADAYAQIGNGGDFINNGAANGSSGTIAGNISVAVSNPTVAGNAIVATAGSGANSYVQIGNGGNGENTPGSGNTVTYNISGDITVDDLALTGSNTGANGYAQIGNGDGAGTGTGNISGDITISQGTQFFLTPGTAPGTSTDIQNNTGTGTVSGSVSGYSGGTPPPPPPPAPTSDPTTAGSVSTIIQNSNTPTTYVFTQVALVPQFSNPASDFDGSSSEQTPLEKLAGEDEDDTASDGIAHSVSDLNKSHVTTAVLIPGVLEEIVTLSPRNPHGIPPADEDYSSWGNEAFWRW